MNITLRKLEGWPSGLRRTPGKRVHGNVSGVRIPVPPPYPRPAGSDIDQKIL